MSVDYTGLDIVAVASCGTDVHHDDCLGTVGLASISSASIPVDFVLWDCDASVEPFWHCGSDLCRYDRVDAAVVR